jgi:hypothetical protein
LSWNSQKLIYGEDDYDDGDDNDGYEISAVPSERMELRVRVT